MRLSTSQRSIIFASVVLSVWTMAGVLNPRAVNWIVAKVRDVSPRRSEETLLKTDIASEDEDPQGGSWGVELPMLLSEDDTIYTGGNRNSPIVIEKYKLLFFPVAKVGSSVWKRLFRRMMGNDDWQYGKNRENHDPDFNGLAYLYQYSPKQANFFLTSPWWTRAIFVRDPKERLLSAFLDKKHDEGMYYRLLGSCCSATEYNLTQDEEDACVEKGLTFERFVNEMMVECDNVHWRPIYNFIDEKFWPYINFVGRMENIGEDAKKMLQIVGAWEEFGSSGWGDDHDDAMFGSSDGRKHATDAKARMRQYFTPELEQKIEAFYETDYSHEKLNFTNERISDESLE